MRMTFGGCVAAALALGVAAATALQAQMNMQEMHTPGGPLGIPETRMGSGTSWLPDASPMHAGHVQLGAWKLMLHGAAFCQYDNQGGPRGADQAAVVNWGMLAASRPLAGGALDLHAMLSAEPWTVGAHGYPLLLQSGESYQGAALHDRQHPHDLFMELAGSYRRAVAQDLAVSLYLAPVGEPALGPVAYPHRPSAASDPLAPLAHHWEDATHISYGVITAGLFTRAVLLEGSWFNGREPDENRTDFDYAGRHLDSYAGRLTVNPGPGWSLAAWYGYLASPEGLHPDESLHRFGASALHTRALGSRGEWATALIYGANATVGTGQTSASVLVETNVGWDGANAVFGRAEYVRKRPEDLGVTTAPPGAPRASYDVGALSLGYVRELAASRSVVFAVGVRGAVSFVPAALASLYGARAPLGAAMYLRLRPREVMSH